MRYILTFKTERQTRIFQNYTKLFHGRPWSGASNHIYWALFFRQKHMWIGTSHWGDHSSLPATQSFHHFSWRLHTARQFKQKQILFSQCISASISGNGAKSLFDQSTESVLDYWSSGPISQIIEWQTVCTSIAIIRLGSTIWQISSIVDSVHKRV